MDFISGWINTQTQKKNKRTKLGTYKKKTKGQMKGDYHLHNTATSQSILGDVATQKTEQEGSDKDVWGSPGR